MLTTDDPQLVRLAQALANEAITALSAELHRRPRPLELEAIYSIVTPPVERTIQVLREEERALDADGLGALLRALVVTMLIAAVNAAAAAVAASEARLAAETPAAGAPSV
jgi:hypothetical protein